MIVQDLGGVLNEIRKALKQGEIEAQNGKRKAAADSFRFARAMCLRASQMMEGDDAKLVE